MAESGVWAAHESGGANRPAPAWVGGFIDTPNSKFGTHLMANEQTAESPPKTTDLEAQLRRFSRSVLQGDYRGTYRAHKEIYRTGKAAIPLLKARVLGSDFSNQRYPEATRYASALVNLIRDIDEDEARAVAQQIIEKGCVRPLRLVLDSICRFSLTDYTDYSIRGVRVLQHQDLSTSCDVRAWLERWMANISEKDLEDLIRIFVVRPDDVEREAAGTYTPYLHKVTLVWNVPDESFPSRLLLLFVEATLYHEIGHHVCRHEFGQDPVQEREADAYANQLLKKAHPRLAWVLRMLRAGRPTDRRDLSEDDRDGSRNDG